MENPCPDHTVQPLQLDYLPLGKTVSINPESPNIPLVIVKGFSTYYLDTSAGWMMMESGSFFVTFRSKFIKTGQTISRNTE